MTQRTDSHSPVNVITEDYEYLFAADLNSPWALGLSSNEAGREFLRELSNLDPATEDRGYCQCHHCGQRIRYVAWLKHVPTGYTIVVGETCLDNRFGRATADFQRLRKQAQLDREAQKIRKAIDEFVAANPDLAWMDRNGEVPEIVANNSFVLDVTRKLRQYGSLSENQTAAVRRVIATTIERQAQREQDAIENPAAPVVEGRIVVTGEVLTTKWQDSDFGSTLKMLVRDDRGFKVWGSVPKSLQASWSSVTGEDTPSVEKGNRVTFTAQVEKSRDDETFGFFKRPTQAKVV
jgi:hypothetical protein